MIQTMKIYEKACVDNAKKYVSWDMQCVSKDSFLEGVRYTISLMSEKYPQLKQQIEEFSNQKVEVEFNTGSHQLINDISAIASQKKDYSI
jgi:hypothetical protein